GPAIAGIVIAQVNVGAAFALNAATYVWFFATMTRLRRVAAMSGMAPRNVLKASAEAYLYVSRHPGIAPMLMLFTITTIATRGYVELPFVFVAGAAMVITGVGAQTLIQASVEPQMRGRVMALYGMIFRAGPALGALLIGSLSERFGLRLPLAIGAVISVAVCALTWARQRRMASLLESEPPAHVPAVAAEKRAP